jgi:hypothetical protein
VGIAKGVVYLRNESDHAIVRIKAGKETHGIKHVPKVARRGDEGNTRGLVMASMPLKHTLNLFS